MNKKLIKICFVIDTLEIGGTEKQLIEVINNLDPAKFKTYLVCLKSSQMFESLDANNCNKASS